MTSNGRRPRPHRKAQRYGNGTTEPVAAASPITAPTDYPSTRYRQVLALSESHGGNEIVLSFVGGDSQPHPADERFFIGRWRGHHRRGNSDQARALNDLMKTIPLRAGILETAALAGLSAAGHREADQWHALRAAMQLGLATRTSPLRRLPRELLRMFAGRHSQGLAFPERELQLTTAGRAWVKASPLAWEPELSQMLIINHGLFKIDFAATPMAAMLHDDLASLIQELSAVTNSVNSLVDEAALLRDLLNGREVPRTRRAAPSRQSPQAWATSASASLIAQAILRLFGV